MYRLYGFSTQNTKKVLYTLEELGAKYEFEFMNLFEGGQRKPEFLAKNPTGKVPLLQHDDDHIFESGAICRYVANVSDSKLYPQDKLQRAKVDQWMDFFSVHLGRWYNTLYFQSVLKVKANLGETDEAQCEEARKFIARESKMLNRWLGDHKFLTGEELTIADLFAFAYVEQAFDCKLSLDEYPQVKRWFESIESLESVGRARQKLEA